MDAANRAPTRDTGSLGGQSALVPGMWWGRVFPGDERQLGILRRWLASLLPDCPARNDVACVANELGTNAIVHTASGRGGWFAVEITWHRPVVRVAVADCGAPDGPQVVEDPAGEHGRGLVVVRGLSVRTGVCGDQRGRLVWADVAWDDAGAAEPASSQDPYEAVIRDGQARLAGRFVGVPTWFGLLAGGLAVRYCCGWLVWPAGRLSRQGRPLHTLHSAHDPAGAARRLTLPSAARPVAGGAKPS
jgi:histidine kinase-like protein